MYDPEKDETLVFLTNHLAFGATTIAAIYKDRWQIELFFKALKQNLKIKTFVGTSANALKVQVWTALIAMLLLKYLQLRSRFGWSLSNLVALLRMNLFTHRDLWAWLDQPFEGPPAVLTTTQGELALALIGTAGAGNLISARPDLVQYPRKWRDSPAGSRLIGTAVDAESIYSVAEKTGDEAEATPRGARLTRAALAGRVQSSQVYIAQIEGSARTPPKRVPSLTMLEKLAKALRGDLGHPAPRAGTPVQDRARTTSVAEAEAKMQAIADGATLEVRWSPSTRSSDAREDSCGGLQWSRRRPRSLARRMIRGPAANRLERSNGTTSPPPRGAIPGAVAHLQSHFGPMRSGLRRSTGPAPCTGRGPMTASPRPPRGSR